MKHFGNLKNEKLLKSPIFYGENEYPVQICVTYTLCKSDDYKYICCEIS